MTDGRDEGGVYSKDYWDLVLSQVRSKPSAVIALCFLLFLYAVAIFAPVLANDRPLILDAIDPSTYRRSLNSLRPISLNLRGMIRDGEAAYVARMEERRSERVQAEQDTASSDEVDWGEALAAEKKAIAGRLSDVQAQLRGLEPDSLANLSKSLDETVTAATRGETQKALEAADRLVKAAGEARASLQPVGRGEEPQAGKTVALAPIRSYPALAAISGPEVYFMGLWTLVLLCPLWNRLVNRWFLGSDRERVRRVRRHKLLSVVALPLLPALFWQSADVSFEMSRYKALLTSGEMEAVEVVFTPVPFGFAEIHDREYFRPPTWNAMSEITEEGYYARGPRSNMVDVVTGYRPPPKPVEVRRGEPPRNALSRHVLGTDSLGRDILARMIWGARVSLSVGLVSTIFLLLIGTIVGALAGYYGGWVDVVISRVIEVVQCFPVFFLILIVVSFVGQSILNIMIVIGVFRWTGVARLVRGEFMRLRSQDFVVASEALGVPPRRTIFRHVLPNAMGPVLVAATFAVASGILTESALSYLGLGISAPIPSWGSLVTESKSAEYWWIQIFPGLMIFLTVVLYNLLGEGVRDALDPRLKKA